MRGCACCLGLPEPVCLRVGKRLQESQEELCETVLAVFSRGKPAYVQGLFIHPFFCLVTRSQVIPLMSLRWHLLDLSSLAALTAVALWLALKWSLCSTAACVGVQQFGISRYWLSCT